ncbi:hypothetical protein HG535_0B06130 [Zygotorulaspora mrakii]|uniref:Glutamyl-tRNA(Gln) amidotransferase subunit F, mitochondrial n=1 Tax=Zygotorulaspora mrakii TaxID=42260 RepID=A0A7H9B0S1_ZYGMR|nr:uncharacterized protein HG535_0B06130 [Zygotorulaspora mrakii]QLG71569.1 hypothetical protein HG535_0B06130 [Zygotorulaspora mrakii]
MFTSRYICNRSKYIRFIRVVCRRYSLKPVVGKKFTTIDQVKEYMSKETWSVAEYLDSSAIEKDALPSRETALRVLKLSGLPSEGSDIDVIRGKLGKQLLLINKLHSIPLEDKNIDAKDARIMPRHGVPLTYEKLVATIESQKKNPETGELDDSWDSTGLAKLKKDGYLVVRGGLITNRD